MSKRTRTNVKQSKFGCFTCKARRIKCDEVKPACHRCSTANRVCQGYPLGAPSGPSFRNAPAGVFVSPASGPLTTDPTYSSSPFVELACTVLVQSPRRARNDLELAFWSHTVPQLAHLIPSIRASVEAFGASYHDNVLQCGAPCTGLETSKRYTRALRLVQDDLATLRHGAIPCVIACLFLASVETLQQRLAKGHLHLLGAFSLMMSNMNKSNMDKKFSPDVNVEAVSLLLQKLALHVGTYAFLQPPNQPRPPSVTKQIIVSDPPDQALFKILHSCYHFTAEAFPYKYANRRSIPPELLIEQGRQLGNLKQWLSYNKLPPPRDANYRTETESLLVLRSQCLAALIYTANILDPRETAYDCYAPDFQEIVTLIEALPLKKDEHETYPCSTLNTLPPFIAEMGVIQPLYFTAQKYRNSYWRRKALDLLLESGKEGPWCGATDGSVVVAVIRAEEGLIGEVSSNRECFEDSATKSQSSIPERRRVNACWTIDPEEESGEFEQTIGKRLNHAVIVRCLDIEGYLRDEAQQPCNFPWNGSKYWETWIEKLDII